MAVKSRKQPEHSPLIGQNSVNTVITNNNFNNNNNCNINNDDQSSPSRREFYIVCSPNCLSWLFPFSIWFSIVTTVLSYVYLYESSAKYLVWLVLICFCLDVLNRNKFAWFKIGRPPLLHRNFQYLLKSACSLAAIGMLITVAVTSLYLLFDPILDLEYSRAGLATASNATIFARIPSGASRFRLRYRPRQSSDDWSVFPSDFASAIISQQDWNIRVQIQNLRPDTVYEYQWINSDDLAPIEFSRCGRRDRKCDKPAVSTFKFKTAPSPTSASSFTFAFGSCMIPNFPFGAGMPGLGLLASLKADFFISLGDFIYSDLRVVNGKSLPWYQLLYRETMAQPEMLDLILSSETGIIGMVDDHELVNNWNEGDQNSQIYHDAMLAFDQYVGLYSSNAADKNGAVHFTFEYGAAGFFIMDTRSLRSIRDEAGNTLPLGSPQRTMLGQKQKQDLFDWLLRVNGTHPFKIIASSVPFTFNFWNDDTWWGFPNERQQILDFINTNGIENVVFITGDRHQVGVTRIEFENTKTPIIDASVSPINQFSPPVDFFWEIGHDDLKKAIKNDVKDPLVLMQRWNIDRRLFYSSKVGKHTVGTIQIESSGGELAQSPQCANPESPVLLICVYALNTKRDPNIMVSDACKPAGAAVTIYSYSICG